MTTTYTTPDTIALYTLAAVLALSVVLSLAVITTTALPKLATLPRPRRSRYLPRHRAARSWRLAVAS